MLIKSETKVDKLTKRVESIYEQKELDERKQEIWNARRKQIDEAPSQIVMDFYCSHLGDYKATAQKVITTHFGDLCAYYRPIMQIPAFELDRNGQMGYKPIRPCKNCSQSIRFITDKHWDDYFRDSKMLAYQRKVAVENGDLLQPGDYGFITKYGDPNKKKYEQLEKEEKANFKKKIMV